jgi:hypothetical protein
MLLSLLINSLLTPIGNVFVEVALFLPFQKYFPTFSALLQKDFRTSYLQRHTIPYSYQHTGHRHNPG